jgi:hypothetical protein
VSDSNIERRFTLLGIIGGLMLADHLGDVADEIDHLHDLVGLSRPEGDFIEGWTTNDWKAVGRETEDKGDDR